MSDCEETDVFWASLASSGKRKTKKDSKKDKKHKNNVKKRKTDASEPKKKKKKNSKFKDAMAVRKERKKKKKKKNNHASDPEDGFIFAKSSAKLETTSPRCSEKPDPGHMTPESEKKTKRKKKVAFDLSPGYIAAKRPKVASPSPQRPKDNVLVKAEAAGGGEAEVTAEVTAAPHDNASQATSEDVNSQDLFITQKVFRASPSEPSSDEVSDGAVGPTPQEHPLVRRHAGRTSEDARTPETAEVDLPQEEKDHKHKIVKFCFQTLGEVKKARRPGLVKPAKVLPLLAEPIAVKTEEAERPSRRSTTRSAATQTENWFTAELSSYLSFCRKPRPTTLLQPLDLSLPQRTRRDPRTPPSSAGEVKGEVRRDARRPVTRRGGKTTPSPRTGSDPRFADTTASSEDNEPPCQPGKLDLGQVRAVQTRLNESFFFKTKGDGRSPRPESPLMKLVQGRDGGEVKSRKGH